MATETVTIDNIQEAIDNHEIVVLDFWASWCGPCRSFAPVFEASSESHEDIFFGKVDTEAQRELAGQLNIRSIPTLMIFRDQVLLYNKPGALRAPQLEELIKQVREVDMEEVQKQLDQQAQQAQA